MTWYKRASDLLAEPDPGPTPWLVQDLIVASLFAFWNECITLPR